MSESVDKNNENAMPLLKFYLVMYKIFLLLKNILLFYTCGGAYFKINIEERIGRLPTTRKVSSNKCYGHLPVFYNLNLWELHQGIAFGSVVGTLVFDGRYCEFDFR